MAKRGRLTKKLERLFAENLFIRLSRWAKPMIQQVVDQLHAEQELCFREAAHQVAALGADPAEYVAAQFEVFDRASYFKRRLLLPKPCHLRGPGAKARWLARGSRDRVETCADAVAKAKRTTPGSEGDVFDPERQKQEFFRESRKLENLTRVMRLPEAAILRRFSDEFTPAFIASRAA